MNSSKITLKNIEDQRIYTPDELPEMLWESGVMDTLIQSRGIEFYNCPCSFDIETYSFYRDGEKACCMYAFMLSLNGLCMLGRTWEEFEDVFEKLPWFLDLNPKKRLLIGVHNLGYEFEFLKDRFLWKKVFAVEVRKPVYAITETGIEFRCTYLLSGLSLAEVAKNLGHKDIQKLDTLDYSLARHSGTPLSDDEKAYCIHDVKIVVLYLDRLLETEMNIMTIPITKTGFVRRFCRKQCFYEGEQQKNSWKKMRYNELMAGLTLTVQEYDQLKRAFQGGMVHASAWHAGKVLINVKSKDQTSAYPFVMVAEQYPMSAPEHVHVKNLAELKKYMKLYCCCFDIEFTDIESRIVYEHYISVSRCWDKHQWSEDNGRLINAKMIKTTITEQDFYIIQKVYKWKKCRISNLLVFRRGYLPRDFIKAVLTLYRDKTTLKGVIGQERDYQLKKEMLNSCYQRNDSHGHRQRSNRVHDRLDHDQSRESGHHREVQYRHEQVYVLCLGSMGHRVCAKAIMERNLRDRGRSCLLRHRLRQVQELGETRSMVRAG